MFDGFDEYILRNRGNVQPMEVLRPLADLAGTTSTRIVITSRTSFWNTNLLEAEVEDFLQETGSQGDADPDQRQDLATTIVGIIINQFPQPEAIVKLSVPWLPALRR